MLIKLAFYKVDANLNEVKSKIAAHFVTAEEETSPKDRCAAVMRDEKNLIYDIMGLMSHLKQRKKVLLGLSFLYRKTKC